MSAPRATQLYAPPSLYERPRANLRSLISASPCGVGPDPPHPLWWVFRSIWADSCPFPSCAKVSAMNMKTNSTLSYFRDKSVLITGASSGIGEELAWQLAQAGAKLTLAARRREELERVAQRIATHGGAGPLPAPCVVTCDVARDGNLEQAVAESVRHFGKLDVVFANAGFGVVAAFKKLSLADYRRQLN